MTDSDYFGTFLDTMRQGEELLAVGRVVEAARDQHEEHCGCEGEACPLGDALARLDKLQGRDVTGTGSAPRVLVVERPYDPFSPSYRARCTSCGAWLSKWDFEPEDALENGEDALRSHSCGK
jgi:hypothetical protein